MDEAYFDKEEYVIPVPYSDIVFLRKNNSIPKKMVVRIETHEENGMYHIHPLILADYSLDELFEKNLLFLIPFYLFNLENELKKVEIQEEAINRQKEEDALTSMQYNLFMDTLKSYRED